MKPAFTGLLLPPRLGLRVAGRRALPLAIADALLDVRAVLLIAAVLIGATLRWCLIQPRNAILSYADVPTHLNLARRVHDDLHPGLGQLGAYWLPLTHVLELPFVWNDYLWHTGLAGAIPSMACYLLSVWCIYQLAILGTGQRVPAVIASLAFAANPNVLYLHVLPMFEPSIIASMLVATLLLAHWLRGGGLGILVFAGAAVSVATTSRYESWGFGVASALAVALALHLRGDRGPRFRAQLLLYLLSAWYAMALWLIWNLSLNGDPLYFLHPSFNNGIGEVRLAVLTKRQLFHATAYVGYSVADNAGPLLVGLGLLGLWRYLGTFGLRAQGLWLYLLAAPFAFDIFFLWFKGTPPILVPQLLPKGTGNIRYGVVTLPLLCLLVAALARRPTVTVRGPRRVAAALLLVRRLVPPFWPLVQVCLLAAVLLQPVVLVQRHYVLSYNEANNARYLDDQQVRTTVAHWMGAHYDGGRILMSTFKGADRIILDSGLPDRIFIHEGSQNTWRCALARPQRWARWIILFTHGDGARKLYDPNNHAVRRQQYFTHIAGAPGQSMYVVYRRNARPWVPPAHRGACD